MTYSKNISQNLCEWSPQPGISVHVTQPKKKNKQTLSQCAHIPHMHFVCVSLIYIIQPDSGAKFFVCMFAPHPKSLSVKPIFTQTIKHNGDAGCGFLSLVVSSNRARDCQGLGIWPWALSV